jgi:hypothetical protein
MVGENVTPAAGRSIAGGQNAGSFAARNLDVQGFAMEVANEIGVDPNNLGAYGLTPQRVQSYEAQTHSGTQNGGSR